MTSTRMFSFLSFITILHYMNERGRLRVWSRSLSVLRGNATRFKGKWQELFSISYYVFYFYLFSCLKVSVQVTPAKGLPNHQWGWTTTLWDTKWICCDEFVKESKFECCMSVKWRMLSLVLWLGNVTEFVVCMKIRNEEHKCDVRIWIGWYEILRWIWMTSG